MTKKRIGIYLLITFGIVWGMTIGYLLLGGSYQDAAMGLILTLSMLSPAIAVIITRKITKEGLPVTGENSLMLGIDLKNKKWIWFLLAFLIPILYWDLGELLYYAIFPQAFDPAEINRTLEASGIPGRLFMLVPLAGLASSFMVSFGALGEEIGWRTYLYPKLEELYGTTKAVIFGGIIWGVWHFPAIYAGHNFGHGYFLEPWSGFFVFTIDCIATGIMLFYITKKTGSVWAPAFMHAAFNSFSGATIIGMAYSEEKLTGIAAQSPVRLLIIIVPGVIFSIFLCRLNCYKDRKGKQKSLG
ncbi:MAG: CPBP family intramembrane metalloprotease [Roseburia sp.]|nr:CPBP family intramembrane metalloprotease [Roseburia sp.]MCM1280158.1 CPBP family intramembrane metalloprotease [Robinsoniella sp.]